MAMSTWPNPGGAKGIRTPDLLDANESTWAFMPVDRVGCDRKPHVRALEQLGSKGFRRSYCGLTADQPIGELVRCAGTSWCSDHPTAVHPDPIMGTALSLQNLAFAGSSHRYGRLHRPTTLGCD
jgi:hypothetical protein